MVRITGWLGVGAALAVIAAQASARSAASGLKGNTARFFSADDYPLEALRLRQEGRVIAKLWIDITGKVVSCTITQSSGSPSLDQRTCEIALAKIVYEPALDRRGRPIAASTMLPVRWVLPSSGSAANRFLPAVTFASVLEQVVNADGQRRSCVFRINGTEQPNPEQACAMGRAEIDEVLAKLPDDFRGRALVVFSESVQDYSGSPPAIRLKEADLTIVGRITTHFTISTDGQVSGCRVEGAREPRAWLGAMPCSGAPPFRGASGDALTHPVEATWTVVQAIRLLPERGGV